MKRVRFLLLSAIVIAVDLVSKQLAFGYLRDLGLRSGETHWLSGDWLGLALVENRGVTGGMGAGLSPWILTGVVFVAAVGITVYLLRAKTLSTSAGVGLALILGGAVGNLYDRFLYGYVRDFIDVWPRLSWPPWLNHWPTFNAADSAIVIGVMLLILFTLLQGISEKRKKALEADS